MRTAGLEEAPKGSDEEAKEQKGCGHWGEVASLTRIVYIGLGRGASWGVAGVRSVGSSLGEGGRGNGWPGRAGLRPRGGTVACGSRRTGSGAVVVAAEGAAGGDVAHEESPGARQALGAQQAQARQVQQA